MGRDESTDESDDSESAEEYLTPAERAGSPESRESNRRQNKRPNRPSERETEQASDRSRELPTSHQTRADPDPRDGVGAALSWFRHSENQWVAFTRETLVSLLVVIGVGLALFAVSGVWPPLVAVESDSMHPHLQKGDLVLVMDETRLSPDFAAADTGVVTAETGQEKDYEQFGGYGDVIVYKPYGSEAATPIIHRAHLYVEEGENWHDRAEPAITEADSCRELGACPAPANGFITSGDNPVSNDYYDQERGISSTVKPEWVRGRAVVRVPWVGWIRLAASDLQLPGLAVTGFGPGM